MLKLSIKQIAAAVGVSLIALTNAHAVSYQVFANIAFSNPATLNQVKHQELIIGGTTLFSRFQFEGTAAGVSGSTTSRTTDVLPYGRLAIRLSPKLVAGLDITSPYFTDIEYARNSIIKSFATETYIEDTDYSPKLSFQPTERLALGIGFNANNFYNGQLNFAVPPFGTLTNKANSWAYGWNAGFFYALTQATFVDFSYFSKIVQHAKGKSSWGPFVNNALSANVNLPATYILNVTQLFSPRLAMVATLRYTDWDVVRYTVIQHTALAGATVVVPDHFYSNIGGQLAGHYQVNNKWGVIGFVDYEPNVEPTAYRSPGLPTYNIVVPGIGADYAITKELKAKLVYAHVFSNPPINMTNAAGHIQGHENVNIDAIDFSITYDV